MNKKFFLAVALVAFTVSASAQSLWSSEKSDEKISFGIEAGLNMATMGGDIKDADSRTSFNVGVTVDIPLLQSLYIKTGLQYTSKGYKFDESGYEVNCNASYLEIPILASYRYNFGGGTQLQINAGPYLAYGINGKTEVTESWDDESEKNESDTFDDGAFKSLDYGLQFGAGITIASHYYVGLGYELGLANIADGDGDAKNRNFFINVGYKF